ncbi:hypothetical protein D3C71_1604750 [compost metagenome]
MQVLAGAIDRERGLRNAAIAKHQGWAVAGVHGAVEHQQGVGLQIGQMLLDDLAQGGRALFFFRIKQDLDIGGGRQALLLQGIECGHQHDDGCLVV